jgi:hypothetical protein
VTAAPTAAEPKKKSPWWLPIVVVIGALPAVFAIGIFVFIMRYGWAHEESRCPFHLVETRVVDSRASVVEEARRCMDAVEEHRWSVVRDGAAPLELGRMPLEEAQIPQGFPWTARAEDNRVVIEVTNEPDGIFTLREPGVDAGLGAALGPADDE